jgi:hypothetical protein
MAVRVGMAEIVTHPDGKEFASPIICSSERT